MTGKSIQVWPEIVTILDDRRLADARSDIHPYWRRDGQGLAPGLYVAIRQPAGFNEDSEFRGPFRVAEEAQAALQKLAAQVLRRNRDWEGGEAPGLVTDDARIHRRTGERPLPPKQ